MHISSYLTTRERESYFGITNTEIRNPTLMIFCLKTYRSFSERAHEVRVHYHSTFQYTVTYTAKNAQVVTSACVDILQQLGTTSRYHDAFTWLATACNNKSVASGQQTCCKLIISTGLSQLVIFRPCRVVVLGVL